MNETQIQTPDESKRIDPEELAHYMGYAGKEDTENGIEAEEAGRLSEATESFSRAEQAEKQGAQEYVDVKRTPAEAKRSQAEAELAELATISTKYGVETSDSPELERKVEAARRELAKKYEQYGAKPEDFNLVTYEKDGKTVYNIAYTATYGLDLGDPEEEWDSKRSYRSIMSDNYAHLVAIDGVAYDTRAGMTLDVYRAFVEAKIQANEKLPDNDDEYDTAVDEHDQYTVTLLTGEKSVGLFAARIAFVDVDDSVFSKKVSRGDDEEGIRFRPAVELQV